MHKVKLVTIPAGTPVGMSALLVHHHHSIFPSPEKFDPERWLHSSGARLDKYLLSFSKGSRQCLGIKSVHLSL